MKKYNNETKEVLYEDVVKYSKEMVIDLLRRIENKEFCIEDVISSLEKSKYKVCVYRNRITKEIYVDDIYYITVFDGITKIFTKNDSYNSYKSLNEWEKRFKAIKSDKFSSDCTNFVSQCVAAGGVKIKGLPREMVKY